MGQEANACEADQQHRKVFCGATGAAGYRRYLRRSRPAKLLIDTVMTEKFAPPVGTIRRYAASRICDVVVVVRGQEMVIRCPSYSHALKWAALERKSYKIPDPIITDFSDNEEPDDVPLFLRPDRN